MELFLAGSAGFWIFLVLISCVLFYCAEKDMGGLATVTLIGSMCFLNWCCDVPVFVYMYHNPWSILPGLVGYFVLGTVWSVIKWIFYVKDQREKYDDLKQGFIDSFKLEISVKDPIPDAQKQDWLNCIRANTYEGLDVHPKIKQHKIRVYIWIAYWPWSLIWTVINDPVRKILNRIYRNIAEWMQSISDRYFKDTKQDFK
jgi:hypothetical protein